MTILRVGGPGITWVQKQKQKNPATSWRAILLLDVLLVTNRPNPNLLSWCGGHRVHFLSRLQIKEKKACSCLEVALRDVLLVSDGSKWSLRRSHRGETWESSCSGSPLKTTPIRSQSLRSCSGPRRAQHKDVWHPVGFHLLNEMQTRTSGAAGSAYEGWRCKKKHKNKKKNKKNILKAYICCAHDRHAIMEGSRAAVAVFSSIQGRVWMLLRDERNRASYSHVTFAWAQAKHAGVYNAPFHANEAQAYVFLFFFTRTQEVKLKWRVRAVNT